MAQYDRRSQPVTRGEFESFRNTVLDDIGQISRKLDEQLRRSQWSIGQILMAVAVFGTPLVFTIRNLYQTQETARVLASHLEFSEDKAAEFSKNDSDLRERARGLEGKAIEGETQHKWMADVENVVRDYEDRMRRAYCSVCDRTGLHSRIVYPDPRYQPLGDIGEARNGNGH